MVDINIKLKELQPYVINIRFPKGLSVVDAKFKPGWTLPKSTLVGFEPIPNNDNFFMLYSLDEKSAGVSELLGYVETVIKLNVERELKYELLTVKIKELERLFSTSSLDKCKTLEFNFQLDSVTTEFKVSDIPLIIENEVIEREVVEVAPTVVKNGNEIVELPVVREKIILEEFKAPRIVCKCGPTETCPICYVDED